MNNKCYEKIYYGYPWFNYFWVYYEARYERPHCGWAEGCVLKNKNIARSKKISVLSNTSNVNHSTLRPRIQPGSY